MINVAALTAVARSSAFARPAVARSVRSLSLKPLYTAEATATGAGRNGHVRTHDGIINLDLAVPKGLGGPGGPKTNPEQLFASGYAACFLGALNLVAKKANVKLPDTIRVDARVHIGAANGGFGLETELNVSSGADNTKMSKPALMELVNAAHKICPYSVATRGNMQVHVNVV